jgi:hypothetical protein
MIERAVGSRHADHLVARLPQIVNLTVPVGILSQGLILFRLQPLDNLILTVQEAQNARVRVRDIGVDDLVNLRPTP